MVSNSNLVTTILKSETRGIPLVFISVSDPIGSGFVTDLARPHAMSLPAVSKHLRVLENAGLIRRKRYGRVHQLKLEAMPMKQAAQWVEEYRRFWESSLDRLARYLEKTNKQPEKKETK